MCLPVVKVDENENGIRGPTRNEDNEDNEQCPGEFQRGRAVL